MTFPAAAMGEHGGVDRTHDRGSIIAPFALLGVSLTAALVLTGMSGELFPTANIVWFCMLTAAVAALRGYGLRVPDRSPRAQAVFWIGLALTAGLVVLNPAFGLYAFLGYPDSVRQLPRRHSVAGMVAVALVVAVAQTGGVRSPIFTLPIWALFVAVNLVIAGLMGAFDRQRQRQAEAVEAANAELRQALARNAELNDQLIEQARAAGVSEERSRLAREIHDTIAQDLVAIIAQLTAAADAADAAGADPQEQQRRLDQAEATARGALAEARRSVRALSSPRLDSDDLPAALGRLLEAWQAATGATAELVVEGEVRPGRTDGVVLRIVQEALANVARHASAASVRVALAYAPDSLAVEIRDDGVGFDVDAPRSGHGLTNMANRARAAGGDLRVSSVKGEGTRVGVELPGRDR
ncbi:MAG: sensor histidine kinase [Propionibacteriaceae bacterium]|nr:sensor histidine kinase [Propionibacteriaceae bacterium]